MCKRHEQRMCKRHKRRMCKRQFVLFIYHTIHIYQSIYLFAHISIWASSRLINLIYCLLYHASIHSKFHPSVHLASSTVTLLAYILCILFKSYKQLLHNLGRSPYQALPVLSTTIFTFWGWGITPSDSELVKDNLRKKRRTWSLPNLSSTPGHVWQVKPSSNILKWPMRLKVFFQLYNYVFLWFHCLPAWWSCVANNVTMLPFSKAHVHVPKTPWAPA